MHQAQRRNRARSEARPLPPYSRSCADRRYAEGKRPDRGRTHRRSELAPHRQPPGVEDQAGGRQLGRALPRRGRQRILLIPRPSSAGIEQDKRTEGLIPVRLSTRATGFETDFRQLLDARRDTAADVDAAVAVIVDDVARRGDAALIEHTRRLDRVELAASDLRLTRHEIAERA